MHPLLPSVFVFKIGLEAKGLLDFHGRRGITPVVWRNPHPVIFGVELRKALSFFSLLFSKTPRKTLQNIKDFSHCANPLKTPENKPKTFRKTKDCDLAGLLQSPKTPKARKYEKNTKSPTPGWPPKIQKKYRKKYENGPKTTIFGPFLYFFCIFSVFPGVNPGCPVLPIRLKF